jgi:DNA-binding winged helix-turn-helix (wHTH) protein
VWSDTVVSDDALTSCIQELRRALEDDARQPRFIETRHRRGYRFVARLSAETPEDVPDSPPAADLSAIAVLPFADMSPGRDQDSFARRRRYARRTFKVPCSWRNRSG